MSIESKKETMNLREWEVCKSVREMYHHAGCPSIQQFKRMVMNNIYRNCPITIKDISLAEELYGKDVAGIKGRNVRKQPKEVKDERMIVPNDIRKKAQALTLCADIMYVWEQPFLTSIDRQLKYRSMPS